MAMTNSKNRSGSRSRGGSSVYDGFISYSHAADDLLAPRLQAGLQSFAKPWWKRRALRIFRDESSLSANPHLWSSIVEALDSSEWFVLLLSPDAAQSEWVNQEIGYWTTHKDPSRILPVVTEGEFAWKSSEGMAGSSVPNALEGVLEEEPRWVDLRFARGDSQVDLKDPRFADAVADIASAIRGVPKDELASEEVRQHRRTVRTAFATGVALAALAVAATVFGIQSANNAAEAELQESIAASEADRANEEADRANDEANRANEEADRANENAQLARSRELAAAAISVLNEDPELSMMLALESISATPRGQAASPQGVIALRQAMASNRLYLRTGTDSGGAMAALSPDGGTLYYASFFEADVTALDLLSETEIWTTPLDGTTHAISVSPDGAHVAVGVINTDRPGAVAVLNASDGQVTQMLESGECRFASVWSGFTPDGSYLGVNAGSDACDQDPGGYWVDLYDTETWEPIHRLTLDETRQIVNAVFSAEMSRVLIFAQPNSTTAELRSFPDLGLINTFEQASWAALSPDGDTVVLSRPEAPDLRPVLVEADTGNLISYLEIDTFLSLDPFTFSPDGSQIAVTTRDAEYVFDAETGATLDTWRASGFEYSHSFTPTGDQILTTSDQGSAIWSVSANEAAGGIPLHAEGIDLRWINPDGVIDGPELAIWTLIEDAAFPDLGFGLATLVLDPDTLSVDSRRLGLGTAQLPDGRILLWEAEAVVTQMGPDRTTGPTVIWDPKTDTTTVIENCRSTETTPSDCFATRWIEVSPGGSVFAMSAEVGEETRQMVRVQAAEDLDLLGEFEVPQMNTLVGVTDDAVVFVGQVNQLVVKDFHGQEIVSLDEGIYNNTSFSSDGSLMLVTTQDGAVEVFQTENWESVARWKAHAGLVRGVALSGDESMLATTGEDDFVNIWDITDLKPDRPPPLRDRIPAKFPSDAVWLSDEELVIFLAVKPLAGINTLRVSLNTDNLVDEARGRLTRGFTPVECGIYNIDPCPTFEELLEG